MQPFPAVVRGFRAPVGRSIAGLAAGVCGVIVAQFNRVLNEPLAESSDASVRKRRDLAECHVQGLEPSLTYCYIEKV